MKVTMTFNLPEDNDLYYAASHGMNSLLAMIEFGEWLRTQIKHNPDQKTEGEIKVVREIATEFYGIVDEFHIDFDCIS